MLAHLDPTPAEPQAERKPSELIVAAFCLSSTLGPASSSRSCSSPWRAHPPLAAPPLISASRLPLQASVKRLARAARAARFWLATNGEEHVPQHRQPPRDHRQEVTDRVIALMESGAACCGSDGWRGTLPSMPLAESVISAPTAAVPIIGSLLIPISIGCGEGRAAGRNVNRRLRPWGSRTLVERR